MFGIVAPNYFVECCTCDLCSNFIFFSWRLSEKLFIEKAYLFLRCDCLSVCWCISRPSKVVGLPFFANNLLIWINFFFAWRLFYFTQNLEKKRWSNGISASKWFKCVVEWQRLLSRFTKRIFNQKEIPTLRNLWRIAFLFLFTFYNHFKKKCTISWLERNFDVRYRFYDKNDKIRTVFPLENLFSIWEDKKFCSLTSKQQQQKFISDSALYMRYLLLIIFLYYSNLLNFSNIGGELTIPFQILLVSFLVGEMALFAVIFIQSERPFEKS